MDSVRIGFVGVGAMGQCAHLKNYKTIPGCEVAALAEVREDLGRQVALRYGVPRVYRSHTEMLANEALDGIVASQPFTRHGVLLPSLYEAGIPLFTEKPLSGSVEYGERLVSQLRTSRSWHMVGYHKRSDPATMQAKAIIDSLKETGELGPLKYVRLLMPAGDWVSNGFTDLIASDEPLHDLEYERPANDMDSATNDLYISFVNYYIHQVNLMRWLLGEPYEAVYAEPSRVLFVGRSASGIPCTIEMSPYETTVDWQESALVCFQKGWVKLELPAPLALNRPGRLEIYRDSGSGAPCLEVPALPWVHAMRQQAMNFVSAIRGLMAPMCDAEEALEDLKIARQYVRLLTGR